MMKWDVVKVQQWGLITICIFYLALQVYLYVFPTHLFNLQLFNFILFLALTGLINRYKQFFRDWLVFFGGILAFNNGRRSVHFITNTFHLPIHSDYVIEVEQLFTPNHSLSGLLQVHLTTPGIYSWLERLCLTTYALHFISFFLIGFIIWHQVPQEFWRYKRAILSCFFIGLLGYLIVPTIPPWLAAELALIPAVKNLVTEMLSFQLDKVRVAFDTNPVAAMPSLHTAIPTICTLALSYHFGKKSWPAYLYLGLMIFSCFLLGAHYILDVVAGLLLGGGCFYFYYAYQSSNVFFQQEATTGEVGLELGKFLVLAMIISLLTMLSAHLEGLGS